MIVFKPTFDFTLCNFMFGLLLDNKAAATVAEAIGGLKQRLSDAGFRFGDIFPLLLTDNGSEFSDVYAFENDFDGNFETHLFFCDPYTPSQKPRVEKNHTLFRDIVPKGRSFDDFTQDTVNMIFSHVNAVARKSLYGKTPYEIFAYTFSEQLAHVLGITVVAPQDVVQSTSLLRD